MKFELHIFMFLDWKSLRIQLHHPLEGNGLEWKLIRLQLQVLFLLQKEALKLPTVMAKENLSRSSTHPQM